MSSLLLVHSNRLYQNQKYPNGYLSFAAFKCFNAGLCTGTYGLCSLCIATVLPTVCSAGLAYSACLVCEHECLKNGLPTNAYSKFYDRKFQNNQRKKDNN